MRPINEKHRFIGVWTLFLGASLFGCGQFQTQEPEAPLPVGEAPLPTGEAPPPGPVGDSPTPVDELPTPVDEPGQEPGSRNFYVEPSPNGEGVWALDIPFTKGETVAIGTCGIYNATSEGDTVLWLYGPDGGLVTSNNDGAASGCQGASKVDFTSTVSGNHQLRVGCLGASPCHGTVGIGRRKGLIPFEVANTDSAMLNTYNKQFKFFEGDVVRISTCARNAHEAFAEGNTYLRFYQQSAGIFSEVASNDDAQGCGASSEIRYTIPSTGYYQVRIGCAANMSCQGSVALYVE